MQIKKKNNHKIALGSDIQCSDMSDAQKFV